MMTEQQITQGPNGAKSELDKIADAGKPPAEKMKDPTVKCVTPEEVLLGENYSLRVMNLSLQKQIKERELEKLEARIQRETQELMLYRQKLSEKYNIDFSRFEIEAETGKIIPAGIK